MIKFPSRVAEITAEWEMVLHVARAMFLAEHPGATWSAGRARYIWFARAEAAIRGMRDPTMAMIEAAGMSQACVPPEFPDDGATFYPAVAWRAMIDAALPSDSGRLPKGEDAPAAECEASQSSDAEGGASPILKSTPTRTAK